MPFPPIGSPGGATGAAVGTGTLTFSDANNGTFAYTVKGRFADQGDHAADVRPGAAVHVRRAS